MRRLFAAATLAMLAFAVPATAIPPVCYPPVYDLTGICLP